MEPIRLIKPVGGHDKAPKCARCGKALIPRDQETAPLCHRCSLIVRMEQAVANLAKGAADNERERKD
jgi:predicted RNA-binding Zn-ribbon protein involved in translation (DUF1610 family)